MDSRPRGVMESRITGFDSDTEERDMKRDQRASQWKLLALLLVVSILVAACGGAEQTASSATPVRRWHKPSRPQPTTHGGA